jgi:hypothetical protein
MMVIKNSSARLRVAVIAFLLILLCPSFSSGESPRKILILPFHVESSERDLQNFSDHVNRSVRKAMENLGSEFSLESERFSRELLKEKSAPETEAEALSIALESHADLVVYGFLTQDDSQFRLQGIMWDVSSGRAIVSTDMTVANIHGLAAVLQLFIASLDKRLHGAPRLTFYQSEPPVSPDLKQLQRLPTLVALPRNTGPWRSSEIGSALLGLDVGDLDGDKKNEIVFLEESGLTIHRFENGTLRPLTQFAESPAQYISAEIEDLDGDGIAELILCYQTPAGVESAVARYLNRNFRIVTKLRNVILKCIRDDISNTKKRILVGQRTDVADMFSGEMVLYCLQGDTVKEEGTIQLPPGTLILSYDSGELGKPGQHFRVILNQDQRLMLFDRENRLISSISDRIFGHLRRLRIPSGSTMRQIVCPGRIFIADAKGEGENELLVMKSSDRGSYIQALGWNGTQLAEKWKTVESQGSISDFRIRDFKNEGNQSLVMILVKPMQFLALSGPRSVIFAFDLIR